MVNGKGILFNVGGQTGKDCLLTWADGVKVADRRDRTRNLSLRKRCHGALCKWLTSFGFDALGTMERVLIFIPCFFILTDEPSELTNRSGKSPLLARKRCLRSHLTEVSDATEGVHRRCVHDQNKPMWNRLPALIWSEQELPWNAEETPKKLFTWTV